MLAAHAKPEEMVKSWISLRGIRTGYVRLHTTDPAVERQPFPLPAAATASTPLPTVIAALGSDLHHLENRLAQLESCKDAFLCVGDFTHILQIMLEYLKQLQTAQG